MNVTMVTNWMVPVGIAQTSMNVRVLSPAFMENAPTLKAVSVAFALQTTSWFLKGTLA